MFPREHFVVEQGPSHMFTAAEQEILHDVLTVEYVLLPSRNSGIMDEDIQCLYGGV